MEITLIDQLGLTNSILIPVHVLQPTPESSFNSGLDPKKSTTSETTSAKVSPKDSQSTQTPDECIETEIENIRQELEKLDINIDDISEEDIDTALEKFEDLIKLQKLPI